MTEIILKFPLFYVANKEIQSEKNQNTMYYFEFSYSGFPRWQDKRAGNHRIPQKNSLKNDPHCQFPFKFLADRNFKLQKL